MQTDVIESLAARIRDKWVYGDFSFYSPRVPEITTAASLAHHGFLGSVKEMRLENVDLASVPAEHLASLASCVTRHIIIRNVSKCDITNILDSVKCRELTISSQTLSSEETRAVVRAMETSVKAVNLGDSGNVSLDMTALTQYSGQGECVGVGYENSYGQRSDESASRNIEQLRCWAKRINWLGEVGRGINRFTLKIYKSLL